MGHALSLSPGRLVASTDRHSEVFALIVLISIGYIQDHKIANLQTFIKRIIAVTFCLKIKFYMVYNITVMANGSIIPPTSRDVDP